VQSPWTQRLADLIGGHLDVEAIGGAPAL